MTTDSTIISYAAMRRIWSALAVYRHAVTEHVQTAPAVATLLLVGPVLVDLVVTGPRRVFGYLAADAFYYLTIARHCWELGTVSFDQEFPSNGFHPLWQAVCAGLYAAVRICGGDSFHVLVATVMICLVLLGSAIYLLAAIFTHDADLSPWWVVTLPVGFCALVMSPMWIFCSDLTKQSPSQGAYPVFGSLWTYVNGMESALLIFFFAALALYWIRHGASENYVRAGGLGLLLSGLCLARLDHGLVALPILLMITVDGRRHRLWQTATTGGVFGLVLGAYMAINWLWLGVPMPTSGILKSTFPSPNPHRWELLKRLLWNPPDMWLPQAYRMALLLLPMLFAVIHLVFWLRRRESCGRFARFLAYTSLGVLALGTYNFLFLRAFADGFWYYPVPTLFVSLCAAIWLSRMGGAFPISSRQHRRILVAATVAASVLFFVLLHRQPESRQVYARFFFDEAPRIRSLYANTSGPVKLLSLDDGIVAYATELPTMSGTGLALDPAGVRARARGLTPMIRLAVERGFDRVTGLYWGSPPRQPDRLKKWVRRKTGLRHVEPIVEFRSKDNAYSIVRLTDPAGESSGDSASD